MMELIVKAAVCLSLSVLGMIGMYLNIPHAGWALGVGLLVGYSMVFE